MKATSLIILGISAVAGIWWGAAHATATRQETQLTALELQADELSRLQREHARLLGLQPSNDELERLRREAAAHAQSALLARQKAAAEVLEATRSLQPGTWATAAQWKNCGRSTPEAALETMLWAAAGGDLSELKGTLAFDEASRSKVAAILAQAPEATRRQYATPEDLLALTVAAGVPLESAQFVARQQSKDDEATAFVRMKSPDGATRQVHLTLHRSPEGWKLLVPPSTLEAIAKIHPQALAQ